MVCDSESHDDEGLCQGLLIGCPDEGFTGVEQEADVERSTKHELPYGVWPSPKLEADLGCSGVLEPIEGMNVGQDVLCWGPGRTRVRSVRGPWGLAFCDWWGCGSGSRLYPGYRWAGLLTGKRLRSDVDSGDAGGGLSQGVHKDLVKILCKSFHAPSQDLAR